MSEWNSESPLGGEAPPKMIKAQRKKNQIMAKFYICRIIDFQQQSDFYR